MPVRRFTVKPEGDKVRLTWYVDSAGEVEIVPVGVLSLAGSILVEPSESFTLRMDGQDLHTVKVDMSVFEKPEEVERQNPPETPSGGEVIPYGSGFLVVDGSERSESEMAHAADGPGLCPKCGKQAGEWEPPMDNAKYAERHKKVMQEYGLDAEAAHRQILGETGGFIHQCKGCRTDYFVPMSVAKIKGSQIKTGST